VDGSATEYFYSGTQLAGQKNGQTILEFLYDANGSPYAVLYSTNGGSSYSTYYYLLNLQGDVVALADASGAVVVRYKYDVWGKVTAVTNNSGTEITSSTHIANVNPIRYRGYYYDRETQLYYLQSRYYNPAMGRFINADAFASTGQGILGNNMFSYCANDPIAYADARGSMRTYNVNSADSMCKSYPKSLVQYVLKQRELDSGGRRSLGTWIKDHVGSYIGIGHEESTTMMDLFVVSWESGVGYDKNFENGKEFNAYIMFEPGLYDMPSYSAGADLNIGGYGVGIEKDPAGSLAASGHFGNNSFEFSTGGLHTSYTHTYLVGDVYHFNRINVNHIHAALVAAVLLIDPATVLPVAYAGAGAAINYIR